MKWTNYLRGYQKRWFVLSNGLLSYYKTQEEMHHTCRGTLNLAGAFINTIDACHFEVTSGPYQMFHLKAHNEVERQRWVTALELARQKAMENDSGESDDDSVVEEGDSSIKLKGKLKELQAGQDSLLKNCNSLLRSLSELESNQKVVSNSKEKLTAVKHMANSYMKLASEFYQQADHTQKIWAKALKREKIKSERILETMEEIVQDLPPVALTNSDTKELKRTPSKEKTSSSEKPTPGRPVRLEQPDGPPPLDKRHSVVVVASSTCPDDDDEAFVDAISDFPTSPPPAKPKVMHQRSVSDGSILVPKKVEQEPSNHSIVSVSGDNKMATTPNGPVPSFFVDVKPTIANRRTIVPDKPQVRLNLWAIMKNCIGRDLSKIPMPVNFNEPISFTQRVMEDVSYCNILTQAASLTDSTERLAYVGAFSVSSYASTSYRVVKPFNPLLGETYELDRRAEMGWRGFCEQVSHHPPASAMVVENEKWTYWQEFTMTSKFRGAYLTIIPYGIAHLKMHTSGDHYTWSRPNMTVYNIIVGKLYIDHVGETEITNHVTGDRLAMKWHGYTYFTRERQRKVTGTVYDKHDNPRYVLTGYWDDYIECAKVISSSGKNLKTEAAKVVWKMDPIESGIEKRYNFGSFQSSLNEPEEGVAPTDSRLRPDIRLTEQGDYDAANAEKLRLEEKQRAKRRLRESASQRAAEARERGENELAEKLEEEASYNPVWFRKQYDPYANAMFHQYKGGYWEAKQSGKFPELDLPDLY